MGPDGKAGVIQGFGSMGALRHRSFEHRGGVHWLHSDDTMVHTSECQPLRNANENAKSTCSCQRLHMTHEDVLYICNMFSPLYQCAMHACSSHSLAHA